MLYARADAGLNTQQSAIFRQPAIHAAHDAMLCTAYEKVIGTYCDPQSAPFVPALGLPQEAFVKLLAVHLPRFAASAAWLRAQNEKMGVAGSLAEFPDLLQLLLDHRATPDAHHRNVAHLLAAACMGNNHLWQDLGLPDRRALSNLLHSHFPALAEKNTGNMKWKKFFYRQLCERDGLAACNRPSCAACCDYHNCFGIEA